MSTSTFNPHNAPRDPNELAKVGRFKLRRLAEEMGMFTDEASKSRFMAGSNNEMAQSLAVHLQAMDSNGGTAPAVQAPVVVAPAQAPVARQPANEAEKIDQAEQQVTAGGNQAATALLQAITSLRKEVGDLAEKFDELRSEVEAGGELQESLRESVRGTNRLSVIATALSLSLAEQVLEAPRDEVLQAAIGDQSTVAQLVAQLDRDDDEGKG